MCCGPPVLGARQKKEEQGLKLTHLPILHQTSFQLMTQTLVQTGWNAELPNHCSTWNNPTLLEFQIQYPGTQPCHSQESCKAPGQGWSSSFPDTGNNKLNYCGLQQKSPAGQSALESHPVWSDPASVPSLCWAVLDFLAKLFSMRPRKRAWQRCDISIGSINLL